MHVSPAKHSYAWLPKVTTGQTDRRTDRRRTKWSLCAAMICRRHKNLARINAKTIFWRFYIMLNYTGIYNFISFNKIIPVQNFVTYCIFLTNIISFCYFNDISQGIQVMSILCKWSMQVIEIFAMELVSKHKSTQAYWFNWLQSHSALGFFFFVIRDKTSVSQNACGACKIKAWDWRRYWWTDRWTTDELIHMWSFALLAPQKL